LGKADFKRSAFYFGVIPKDCLKGKRRVVKFVGIIAKN
jgi:hypothetical protein